MLKGISNCISNCVSNCVSNSVFNILEHRNIFLLLSTFS